MRRLIATLVVKEGLVVQSIGFNRYLPIGRPEIAVEFLNNWGIDEIILLDIDATRSERLVDVGLIKSISKKCFVPLTVGGGITSIADAEALLLAGADKIAINSGARRNLELVNELSLTYGNQFVVVAIDVIKENGKYSLYDYIKGAGLGHDPFGYMELAESAGAGEFFINTVHCDGMYRGYDLELVNQVSAKVALPLIISGGAGNANHILELLSRTQASAASASNYFNFYEHSVSVAKALLADNNIEIRNSSDANYIKHPLCTDNRLLKKSDQELEDMRFIHIEKEII